MERWNLYMRVVLIIINLIGVNILKILFGFMVVIGFLFMFVLNIVVVMIMILIGLVIIKEVYDL